MMYVHGFGYLRYGVILQVMYVITRFLIFTCITYSWRLYYCFHDLVFLVAFHQHVLCFC